VKDAAGFVHHTAYDPATGSAVLGVVDVNLSLWGDPNDPAPAGWVTPAGGGLHLVTSWEVDPLGRATRQTGPGGRVDYVVYNDASHEVRSALTMSAQPAVNGGRPTGQEAVGDLQALFRSYANSAWQVTHTDAYFSLAWLSYTAGALGAEGVNFYRTGYGYDFRGRQNRTVRPTGTIDRVVYDALGRPVSSWVGTNDAGATHADPAGGGAAGNNMSMVGANEYDSGAVGDSNLTKVTLVAGGGQPDRVTRLWYDWRDRLVAAKEGAEATEDGSVNRPLSYLEYNNLGEVLVSEGYDGDGVAVVDADSDGVPDRPSAGLLRAKGATLYDEQGRAFRSLTYSVSPLTGAVSVAALTTNMWYDRLVSKAAYDGAGRSRATPATAAATRAGRTPSA
jgi:hypothetical protein